MMDASGSSSISRSITPDVAEILNLRSAGMFANWFPQITILWKIDHLAASLDYLFPQILCDLCSRPFYQIEGQTILNCIIHHCLYLTTVPYIDSRLNFIDGVASPDVRNNLAHPACAHPRYHGGVLDQTIKLQNSCLKSKSKSSIQSNAMRNLVRKLPG